MVNFSPRYKLVISLLNQNSAAGDALLRWDIFKLLEREPNYSYLGLQLGELLTILLDCRSGHLAPLLTSLAPLHTFEIQTQIQYFAPLTVDLHDVEGEDGKFVLEEDLKAFINPAGWNLGQLTHPTRDSQLAGSAADPSRPFRLVRYRLERHTRPNSEPDAFCA